MYTDMAKDEDFKLLKIQSCVLKVNIDCDGCKLKVKKILQRIEGVYTVSIDADQQRVGVTGSVDSATLIKKLERAGKHAEVWSQKSSNQNNVQQQKQKPGCIKADNCCNNNSKNGQKQGMIKGLEAFRNQQGLPGFVSEEGGEELFDDGEGGGGEDGVSQMRLVREQQAQAEAAVKNNKAHQACGSVSSKGGDNGGGKKGNGGQNMKGNNQFDPRAQNGNMNHHQPNASLVELKRMNEMNNLINLGGQQVPSASVLSTNPNNQRAFQVHPNQTIHPSQHGQQQLQMQIQHPAAAAMLMNMNGYSNNASMMLMNNLSRQNQLQLLQQQQAQLHHQQQQAQMMYQRSPYIPPNNSYYNPAPFPAYHLPYPPVQNQQQSSSVTHMFSDENTSSCSVM
uniref:HMA domain-containing protein n=1 Tax=Kalanchoe fedtschenkoi TaxID=63787 RepID=A0A7N0VAT1_KALFE